jgi:hypothetical protein
MGGSDFSTERLLESFKSLQLDPWPGYTENPIDDDRIPARRLTGSEGQVGEKGSGAHGSHGGGRCCGREGPRWRVDGEQGRTVGLRGAAMAFRWPEGRRAAGK